MLITEIGTKKVLLQPWFLNFYFTLDTLICQKYPRQKLNLKNATRYVAAPLLKINLLNIKIELKLIQ